MISLTAVDYVIFNVRKANGKSVRFFLSRFHVGVDYKRKERNVIWRTAAPGDIPLFATVAERALSSVDAASGLPVTMHVCTLCISRLLRETSNDEQPTTQVLQFLYIHL